MRVAVGKAGLYGTACWNTLGQLFCKCVNNIVNCAKTDVCKLADDSTLEIGTPVYHHFLGYAEHFVGRSLQVTGFSLLAFLVAEENKVDDFGVEPPGGEEVYLDIAPCHVHAVAVVQTESYLIQVGVTVVLCNGCSSVPECIEAVIVLFCHPHVLADFPNAAVDVGVETVIVTITAVENKQVLVILVF